MIEVKTKKFRLEEGEHDYDFIPFIKGMVGYIPGSLIHGDTEIIADFYEKVV